MHVSPFTVVEEYPHVVAVARLISSSNVICLEFRKSKPMELYLSRIGTHEQVYTTGMHLTLTA